MGFNDLIQPEWFKNFFFQGKIKQQFEHSEEHSIFYCNLKNGNREYVYHREMINSCS